MHVGIAAILAIAYACGGGGGGSGGGGNTSLQSVSPASLRRNAARSATFSVVGFEGGVQWSISGPGTIVTSTSGSVSVLGTAVGTVTVRATSILDPSKSATATLQVLPPISVSLTPNTVSAQVNDVVNLTASVTNATDNRVTWSVTGGTVEVINGNLISVRMPSSPGTVSIQATSVDDPSKSTSRSITVASGFGNTVGTIR